MKRASVTTALMAVLLVLAGCSTQYPTPSAGVEQKIESASSRVDHEELATTFEQQAQRDRAAATRHKRYASIYRSNLMPRSGPEEHEWLARHCDSVAQTYERAAEQNLAMAKVHRELATRMK